MRKEDLAQKLRADFPEFIWRERQYTSCLLTGHYFINCIMIDDNGGTGPGKLLIDDPSNAFWRSVLEVLKVNPEFSDLNTDAFINNYLVDKYDKPGMRVRIELQKLNTRIYSFIKDCIKTWMADRDKLRKSDQDEEALILLHPDCDDFNIPFILKDVKYIVGGDPDSADFISDWRLGVINLKDWNFCNYDLCCALNEAAGNCFGVDREDFSEIEEANYWAGENLLEKLKKIYPEAENITKLFATAWD